MLVRSTGTSTRFRDVPEHRMMDVFRMIILLARQIILATRMVAWMTRKNVDVPPQQDLGICHPRIIPFLAQ